MVRQHLLRERFVPGEQKAAWIASGVRSALKLQIADDMCVEDRLPVELLEEVEHDVWLELLDRGAKWRPLVAQPDHQNFMP